MVLDHFGAFRNIRNQAGIAIAHCLQKAQRHALQIRGQGVKIGIAVELFQGPSLDKIRKQDPVISVGQGDEFPLKDAGIGTASGNHQFFIGFYLPEGLNQVRKALFRHQTAQKQDIFVFL